MSAYLFVQNEQVTHLTYIRFKSRSLYQISWLFFMVFLIHSRLMTWKQAMTTSSPHILIQH